MIGEKDGCGLLVVIDRKPRGVVVKLVRTRKSNHSTTALPGLMLLQKGSCHKLALDNSKEFGAWRDWELCGAAAQVHHAKKYGLQTKQ